MKNIIKLLMVICLAFILTACGKKDSDGKGLDKLFNKDNTTEKIDDNTKKTEPTEKVDDNTKKDEPVKKTDDNKNDEPPVITVDTKKLFCTKDYSSSMSNNIRMTQDVDMLFEDNKVKNMSMVMNFELPENLISSAGTIVNTMKATYDNKYGIHDGVKVSLNIVSDDKFNITIDLDYINLSSDTKTSLGFVGSEDYYVNKTAFISEGYTCE